MTGHSHIQSFIFIIIHLHKWSPLFPITRLSHKCWLSQEMSRMCSAVVYCKVMSQCWASVVSGCVCSSSSAGYLLAKDCTLCLKHFWPVRLSMLEHTNIHESSEWEIWHHWTWESAIAHIQLGCTQKEVELKQIVQGGQEDNWEHNEETYKQIWKFEEVLKNDQAVCRSTTSTAFKPLVQKLAPQVKWSWCCNEGCHKASRKKISCAETNARLHSVCMRKTQPKATNTDKMATSNMQFIIKERTRHG